MWASRFRVVGRQVEGFATEGCGSFRAWHGGSSRAFGCSVGLGTLCGVCGLGGTWV